MSRSLFAVTAAMLVLALAVLPGCATQSGGPKEVVIGATYPMSGGLAQGGTDSRDAVQMAVDLINNGAGEIDLPLIKSPGLPNHGGAKIRVVFSDNQTDPNVAMAETERLITQEKVVGMLGAYASSVTQTSSQVAERSQIPYVTGTASAPALTERGFKYFFRPYANDIIFVGTLFEYLADLVKAQNLTPKSSAIIAEDTLFGQDAVKLIKANLEKMNIPIKETVMYKANASNLDAEVQRLKAAAPDVLVATSYVNDAILITKTMKKLAWTPTVFLGNNVGFNHPDYIKNLGADANGVATRTVANADLQTVFPTMFKVLDMFSKKTGRPASDAILSDFMSMVVMADAVNRAKELKPQAIRDALAATDIPQSGVVIPAWTGVKFDEKGQNTKASAIMMQIQGGKYVTVWPQRVAQAKILHPYPTWTQR